MEGLGKLRIVLAVVFATFLVVILAELTYVLWRRRRFRRRSLHGGGDPETMSGEKLYVPSKELLYFFCWKNQSRVEALTGPAEPAGGVEAAGAVDVEDEVTKWQEMYGPSRLLYTIKEEEREGAESGDNLSAESEAKAKRTCLRDCFEVKILSEEAPPLEEEEEEEEEGAKETTPFSTPCASPPYYTPSSSPTHDDPPGNDVRSPEVGGSVDVAVEVLSLRVQME